MVDKLDFVIHCIQGAYEDKERLRYEDTSRGNIDGDPTPESNTYRVINPCASTRLNYRTSNYTTLSGTSRLWMTK